MSREIAAARATARALGWLGIGLGVAEVLRARRVARLAGLRGSEASVRAAGVREIATGAAILVAERPAPLIWARAAGDVLDLALLGRRALSGRRRASDAAFAMLVVTGVTALDLACAYALGAARQADRGSPYDYGQRSGFPRPPAQMRGLARQDAELPADMRTPEALRPYENA